MGVKISVNPVKVGFYFLVIWNKTRMALRLNYRKSGAPSCRSAVTPSRANLLWLATDSLPLVCFCLAQCESICLERTFLQLWCLALAAVGLRNTVNRRLSARSRLVIKTSLCAGVWKQPVICSAWRLIWFWALMFVGMNTDDGASLREAHEEGLLLVKWQRLCPSLFLFSIATAVKKIWVFVF